MTPDHAVTCLSSGLTPWGAIGVTCLLILVGVAGYVFGRLAG